MRELRRPERRRRIDQVSVGFLCRSDQPFESLPGRLRHGGDVHRLGVAAELAEREGGADWCSPVREVPQKAPELLPSLVGDEAGKRGPDEPSTLRREERSRFFRGLDDPAAEVRHDPRCIPHPLNESFAEPQRRDDVGCGCQELGWIALGEQCDVGLLLATFVFPLELVATPFAFLARDTLGATTSRAARGRAPGQASALDSAA